MFLYLIGIASCANYAILYAGTRDYYNYRFQADACVLYNKLYDRGFSRDNIYLYAYDDIALNTENPYKNHIYHEIHHKKNFYPGTQHIKVKGDDVTPQSFYDVITSLPATSEDYVFVFYGGNGGKGVFSAPTDDLILAQDLANAFNKASSHYKQCLFFAEASFAGSVAKEVKAPNLAIITSANEEETSYAAVYDTKVKAYLSNECSNHLIDILDKQPTITVGELFDQIKTLTLESHVCYYGDESIKNEPISKFFGTPKNSSKLISKRKSLSKISRQNEAYRNARASIQRLRHKAQKEELQLVLEKIVKHVDSKNFDKIMNDKSSKVTLDYLKVLKVFQQKFGRIDTNDTESLNVLKSLSAAHSKKEIIRAIFAILK